METNIRLIASPQAWIEGEAVRQLYATARLAGMRRAVGFPDLHPGKGHPVGAAFVTEGVIYPYLIGGDIGCGMTLFQTGLARREARRVDRWTAMPFNLENAGEIDAAAFLAQRGVRSTEFDSVLGTIGGGNHFAEIQSVEKVWDADAFAACGLDKNELALLVHSGSRGLGETVLRAFVENHRADGIAPETADGRAYLAGHDHAVRWAKANRELIAQRFLTLLGGEPKPVWDGCHNSISVRAAAGAESSATGRWIHRKGSVAIEAPGSALMIPGSRGALSYLVKPLGDGEAHAWSLAHGAGRKWSRSASRSRMRERFRVPELVQTQLGGRVICEDRHLLYEEAPAAYKSIEAVIDDLADAGLVSVIATFRPLLTYKTRGLNAR